MSRSQYEMRKRGREDLIRVQAEDARKRGQMPNMREIEKKAHERADRADAHKDRNIKGNY